jgi:AhpD family alkylhydroperoxidase
VDSALSVNMNYYCVVSHRQDAGKASEMVQVEILH